MAIGIFQAASTSRVSSKSIMNSGDSVFDRFAAKYSVNASSSTAAPQKKQENKMPQKKVIQCSDDEDEPVALISKTKSSTIRERDDGWEKPRDANKMTDAEISRNVRKAQQERDLSKITKRPRPADDDENDRDIVYSKSKNIEPYRKIDYNSKSSPALDNSLLEDTPESKVKVRAVHSDRDEVLRKEREIRSKNRSSLDLTTESKVQKKIKPKLIPSGGMIDLAGSNDEAEAGDSSDEEEDDDNDDDDDDDDDDDNNDGAGGWQDDKSKSDVQEKAMSVLRYCEEIGKTLRSNLSSWAEQASDDITAPASTSAAPASSSNFCTGLMSIRNKGKKSSSGDKMEVLGDDYFKNICPGLVLKAYQLVGVNWLKLLHENNINGVLADDMGLGKTVQSIAFIAWLKTVRSPTADKNTAHLIVVPASTLANWENELKRFCPSLSVVTYHGTQNERADLRHELRIDIRAGRVDVVLSTFTIFERESSKDDRSFMYKQLFEYLIVDEAHCLKVSTSSRFMNLNAIKASHRLLLSGTPVQNDLSELLSLMSFTMPKIFRNINIEEVLEGFGWDKKSGVPNSSSSAVSINQLRGMLAPFVLRRIKTDVLDQLPDKESFLEKVQMTTFQSNVYDNILYGHAKRKEKIKQQFASDILIDDLMSGKIKKSRLSSRNKELLDLTSPNKIGKEKKGGNNINIESSDTIAVTLTSEDKTKDVLLNVKAEDAERIVHELSASEAANLFTALRKAANHPLLLRVRYQDDKIMTRIAEVAYAEGRFGYQCDYKRVRDEVDKFSDFDLHQLCLEFPSLTSLQLDSTALYDSQKMQKLKEMLPALAVRLSYVLLFFDSCVQSDKKQILLFFKNRILLASYLFYNLVLFCFILFYCTLSYLILSNLILFYLI